MEAKLNAEQKRMLRNMNPHAEARMAMIVWGAEYSNQTGGCMDFWDALPDHRKKLCREWVSKIVASPRAPRHPG